MIRLQMKNCSMILTEKQQKYQHYHPVKLINTNILWAKKYCHFDQSRTIKRAKYGYYPLGKASEKQTKKFAEQGKQQVKALEVLKSEENKEEEIKPVEGLFPKVMRTNEIKNEIDEIKKWWGKISQKCLVYKASKYKYDFQEYDKIRFFGDNIYTGKITIDEADIDQSSLLESDPKIVEDKNTKKKYL